MSILQQDLDKLGCAERLVHLGRQAHRLHYYDRSSPMFTADFTLLSAKTRYPFALVLPQSVTEQVLLEKLESLDVHVLRPHKVIGIRPSAVSNSVVEVAFEGGQIIHADYVVAADGARSIVSIIC